MVGIVNRPHTKRMTPLRTATSTALFHFALSHVVPFFDSLEALGFATLTDSALKLADALSTHAACFVAMLPLFAAPGARLARGKHTR